LPYTGHRINNKALHQQREIFFKSGCKSLQQF
jgi:hypothetical protein